MILLSTILTEETPGEKAARLNLKHIGYGKYADRTGAVVAQSRDGELEFINSEKPRPPRPKRPNPAYKDDPPFIKQEKYPLISVKQVPTKENPSFEELIEVSSKYENVINSRFPITHVDFNRVDEQENGYMKPYGIWYAKGDKWVSWMKSESPSWKGDHLYALDLDYSNILTIKTGLEFIDFIQTWCKTPEGRNIERESEWYSSRPQWNEISKHYSGIEFSKYFGEFRFSINWYYPWDIASGCIWKPAIKSIKQIPIL